MKKANIPIILAAVLTVAALFPGCRAPGSGGTITEEKDVADFTSVKVEGTFEVEITRSDSFSITISADENFYDYVAVSKEGETLRIYLNPRHTFTDFTLQARTLEAKITMPALYGLQLSGASKVELQGSANIIVLNASGASEVNLAGFTLNNATARLSGASEATLNVKGRLDSILSDASRLYFQGNPTMGKISVTGASTIKHK